LAVVIDSLGSQEAITGLSEVTFDATSSTGTPPLLFQLDFGDGQRAASGTGRHVYANPGTYTASVAVTDATGRTVTASQPVVVKALVGAWVHAAHSHASGWVEVRRIALTSQTGTRIEGIVQIPGRPDRLISGNLSTPRSLQLFLEDREFGTLEGSVPSVVNGPAPWELLATGGIARGERLLFRAVEPPSGPGPDAVLNHRYFSFGAPFAIRGFSPMKFDGTGSRGDGLSYFIDFGDGQASAEAVAIHPIENSGIYYPRLTVVDRYGRADVETMEIRVSAFFLSLGFHTTWENFWMDISPSGRCFLWFDSQRGAELTAFAGESCGSIAGFLDGRFIGNDEIQLIHRSGATLSGTVDLRGGSRAWRMQLRQTGGREDGREFQFAFIYEQ